MQMSAMVSSTPARPVISRVPDLMLSFRHRDGLAQALTALGRTVVAARRSAGLDGRFAALGAHILLIDARDAPIDALTAVEAVAATVEARGQGLIVLLGEAEGEMAPAFVAAGAHRIIGAPWRDWELAAALLAADRSRKADAAAGGGLLGTWHADLLTGQVWLEPTAHQKLIKLLGKSDRARDVLRTMDREARQRLFSAIRQLRSGAGHAVFVQHGEGGRLVVHLAARATVLTGQVERLGFLADDAMPRDPVTGLPPAEVIDHLKNRGERAIGLLEVGRLAQFNDAAGRAAGDALLSSIAKRLERQLGDDLGPATLVTRVDGARFAVLAPEGAGSARLAFELRALASMFAADVVAMRHGNVEGPERDIALRVSVGMLAQGQSVGAVLAALAPRLSVPRATVQAIDVEAALSGNGLRVLFQPQFAFADDRIMGAEALVRWQHPRLGEIGGAALFAAAKATGLEPALSRAVWQRALQAMAALQMKPTSFHLALNATSADLADPRMPGQLLAMAADAGLAASSLTVEVTEAAVIQRLDDAAAALRRLRAAGVTVALDDFGSGYSGLSWLKRLPVDYIKIDSGFTRDATGAPRDRAILAGVLGLARALDLDVLAEGVETEEQHRQLKAAGCRWYQGHLKAAAIPAEALAAILASGG